MGQGVAAAPGDTKPAPPDNKPSQGDNKPAPSPPALPEHVETRHTIQLGQRSLDYRAIAETIALTDAKGNKTASVFTIAYLADPKPGQNRPVAFLLNGGPGAASVFLHLGAAGPRIMEDTPGGAVPDPPVKLVDNPSTWLDFTDLVFIDPVGTGFSRGESKDDNPGKSFWNVRSDIQSLDSVVRLWLTRHERWGSPVYLIGESYGGFRVAAMAKSLARDEGVVVSGVVMISPLLDTLVLNSDVTALIAGAIELPSYAATVAALSGDGKFDTAPVERFALSDYLVGLAAMKGVPPPGDPFIAKVAAMIGLPADIVRRERGRCRMANFATAKAAPRSEPGLEPLRRDDPPSSAGQSLGPDSRRPDPRHHPRSPPIPPAFNAYAPDGLGYHSELQYRVLPRYIGHQWNFDGAREGEDGLGLALSGLQTALLDHPATKVLIVNGRYDLVTPYFGSRWLVDQLAVPEAVRSAIRVKVYEGGHMMYLRSQSREALAADIAALFAAP